MIPIGRWRDSIDDEADMLHRYMPSKPAKQRTYYKHCRKTEKGQRQASPRWHLEGRIMRKYLSKVDYLSEEITLLKYCPCKLRIKKKDQKT